MKKQEQIPVLQDVLPLQQEGNVLDVVELPRSELADKLVTVRQQADQIVTVMESEAPLTERLGNLPPEAAKAARRIAIIMGGERRRERRERARTRVQSLALRHSMQPGLLSHDQFAEDKNNAKH